MRLIKNPACTPFLIMLQCSAVWASPGIPYAPGNIDSLFSSNSVYGEDKNNSISSGEKSALFWGEHEPEKAEQIYCLIPSQPGCAGMWFKEKIKENEERVKRYEQNKLQQRENG
ncbi:hypothetical protein [Pantoea sp. GL120224-02]|uniref:hypothetical protein n=1 Tax=Pantoea sp. GL120224-02 TaxID=1378084 RepID=UPI000BDAE63C|nr:hypothetical protein [Pantoea sp. GL120224-02]SNY70940.1 hypothetical protein SAMN02744778_03102 [Pantoea sp. GL120224-02]